MPLPRDDEQRAKRTFINSLIRQSNLPNLEGESEMDINNTLLSDEQFEETMELVKENVVIEASRNRTLVFLVIKDTQGEFNKPQTIPCSDGYGISGYARVRDIGEDCYLLDAVECYSLGSIPFAIKLTIPNSGGWKVDLPMPDKMVDRYIAPFFRRQLKEYRQKYPKPRYAWHYFQILNCN